MPVFSGFLRKMMTSKSLRTVMGIWFLTAFSLSCKEESTATRPPAPVATQAQNSNPYGNPAANQQQPAAGATNPTGANGQTNSGVGCSSPDAEMVPNEPGLRECCRKLNPQMTACLGSACWGPGFAQKMKSHMVPGGKCAP